MNTRDIASKSRSRKARRTLSGLAQALLLATSGCGSLTDSAHRDFDADATSESLSSAEDTMQEWWFIIQTDDAKNSGVSRLAQRSLYWHIKTFEGEHIEYTPLVNGLFEWGPAKKEGSFLLDGLAVMRFSTKETFLRVKPNIIQNFNILLGNSSTDLWRPKRIWMIAVIKKNASTVTYPVFYKEWGKRLSLADKRGCVKEQWITP